MSHTRTKIHGQNKTEFIGYVFFSISARCELLFNFILLRFSLYMLMSH